MNAIRIAGIMVSDFTFNHSSRGEKVYAAEVAVVREGRRIEIVPIRSSEKNIDTNEKYIGKFVSIYGNVRVTNAADENRSHSEVFVWLRSFKFMENYSAENDATLDGVISSDVGEKANGILYFFLETETSFGTKFFIPCSALKYKVPNLNKGMKVTATGVFKSRRYIKEEDDGNVSVKEAREIFVTKIEESEDEDAECEDQVADAE